MFFAESVEGGHRGDMNIRSGERFFSRILLTTRPVYILLFSDNPSFSKLYVVKDGIYGLRISDPMLNTQMVSAKEGTGVLYKINLYIQVSSLKQVLEVGGKG
ncbi:unnamed protein product [Lepeophtheirus salmonis]|uniref:(salmon louse) hypothetical protein n=1 Tax=Lepeophtheirus salmonis TaxID=72036 RepID=A0A817FC34_LEPSM|nr:unnamed protein product [Lepeophtheirus salmonis]